MWREHEFDVGPTRKRGYVLIFVKYIIMCMEDCFSACVLDNVYVYMRTLGREKGISIKLN